MGSAVGRRRRECVERSRRLDRLAFECESPYPNCCPFEQSWFRPRCFLRVPKMTDRLGILHCMSVVEYVQFANWALIRQIQHLLDASLWT